MADANRLYEALKNADAAGDTAAATALAAEIRKIHSQSESPSSYSSGASTPQRPATEGEKFQASYKPTGVAGVINKVHDFVAGAPGSASAPEMFARGTTLGLSDYPQAAARYLADKMTGGGKSYNDSLKDQRGAVDQYREDSPWTANAMEIAGGVTSPIFGKIVSGVDHGIAKLAARYGTTIPRYIGYGLQGGASGLAAGLGNARGEGGGMATPGDFAQQGGSGAAMGAALGVAIPAVAEGAMWVGGKIKDAAQGALDRIPGNQPTATGRRMARAAQADNKTAADIRREVDALGPEGTIADLGGNLRGLAEDAANRPGPALQAAEGIKNRQYGMAEDIHASALRATGAAHKDELIAKRGVMTTPLYEEAFAPKGGPVTSGSPQITDDTIEDILRQPESQAGLREGMDSIRRDNVIARARDPNVKPFDPLDYALKRNPETGQWEKVGTPNLRMLDAVIRGNRIQLESGGPDMIHPTTGTPTNKARQIAAFNDELINRVENQLPKDPRSITPDNPHGVSTWTMARNQWREMSKPIEAINEVEKVVEKARDASDITGRLYGSPAARAKLQGLTNDPAKMADFEKTVQNWKTFAETNRALTGNSRTAYRTAAREEAGNDMSGAMIDLASGRPGSFVSGVLRSLGRNLFGPAPGVADQLAPMMSKDRATQDALLNLMRQRAQAPGVSRLFGQASRLPAGAFVPSLTSGGSNQ